MVQQQVARLTNERETPATLTNRLSGRGMLVGLIPSIVINGVLPIILTNVLLNRGVQPVSALVAGAIFPLVDAVVSVIRTRRIEFLSIISLAFIVVGAATSLLSGDARFTLAKNSFFTGVFGAIYLGSLVIGKPLMFIIGRQFVAGGDPARGAQWESLWQHARFRRVLRLMTAVWGCGLVAESAVRIVLVYALSLPITAMQIIAEVLVYGVIAALILWTVAYGKAAGKRGEQERQAALAREAAATG